MGIIAGLAELERLDEIEDAVNHLKIPASFADRFYWLRAHLLSVRERVRAACADNP